MSWLLKVALDAATPVIVAIIGSWIAILYQRVTNRQLEKDSQNTLEVFLQNIAGGILQKAMAKTAAPGAVMEEARERIPDTLKVFPALTPETLAKKVDEKIGILTAEAGKVTPTYPNAQTAPGPQRAPGY